MAFMPETAVARCAPSLTPGTPTGSEKIQTTAIRNVDFQGESWIGQPPDDEHPIQKQA
jgi:hypothetical protein